jgi:hypothetical protein
MLLGWIAATVAACFPIGFSDPGYTYAIRNLSERPILVRLDDFVGYHSDSYVALPGALGIIELGLGEEEQVTLVVMNPDTCEVVGQLVGERSEVTFVYSADGTLSVGESTAEEMERLVGDGRCGGIPPTNYSWIVNKSNQTLHVNSAYPGSLVNVVVPPHQQGYAYHRNDRDFVASLRVMGSGCELLKYFRNDSYQTEITIDAAGVVSLDPYASSFYLDEPSVTFESSADCPTPAPTQSPT